MTIVWTLGNEGDKTRINAANRDLVRFSLWVRSALFQSYLRRFVILWAAGKGANAFTAFLGGLPPLAFRPLTEIGVCAIELGILAVFIRQAHEDILLGNIGLRPSVALVPLVPLHFVLSGLVALLVR